MSTNPFKAFIPYVVSLPDWDKIEGGHIVTDPSAGEWRRTGLVPAISGETLEIDLQGTDTLMAVQFNERILPGKVRDEELIKRVNKLQAQEGRKVSKKEYAELRQQTEFDLLPRAFIRRTVVPVLFYTQDGHWRMLVCTSSQKKADDCVAVMRGVFGEELRPWQMALKRDPAASFRAMVLDTGSLTPDTFIPNDSVVLKGADKKTIRFKDKPIEDADCLQCIESEDYRITEIGMLWDQSEQQETPDLEFVVTENLTFKGIVAPGIKPTMLKDDQHGFAVLCMQNYKAMLRQFFTAFGPVAERPAPTSTVNVDDL